MLYCEKNTERKTKRSERLLTMLTATGKRENARTRAGAVIRRPLMAYARSVATTSLVSLAQLMQELQAVLTACAGIQNEQNSV